MNKAAILAQIEALRKQLESMPESMECEGCGAPLSPPFVGKNCEYCGRLCEFYAPEELDEPPDIRKTNASDDPCPMCQRVHSKDPNAPNICRCMYCGQIDQVAMSSHDPVLGFGVVCIGCCRGAAPRNLAHLEQESVARKQLTNSGMPWEAS